MSRKNLSVLVAFACVAAALFFYMGRDAQTPDISDVPMASGTTFAMNTFIEQKWFGENCNEIYAQVNELIADIEADISMHVASSEIALVNQAAAKEAVEVSQRTFDLLEKARHYSQQSGGSFDITIAPVVSLWGITGDQPHRPSDEELSQAMNLMGLDELELDAQTRTVRLPREGMAIDLGGIAKGWACDEIRKLALDMGAQSGYVSLGGNLMIIGDKPDLTPFKFGLRNPLGLANEYVGVITLKGKTMATTGGYERYFIQDGTRYHHVLDPKTGYPSTSELLSVTVVSENGMLADYLSTALYVLGRDAALASLEDNRFELVIIDSQSRVYVSPSLRESFTPNYSAGDFDFTDYRE